MTRRPVFAPFSHRFDSTRDCGPERAGIAPCAVGLLDEARPERFRDLLLREPLVDRLQQLAELRLGGLEELSLPLHLRLRLRRVDAVARPGRQLEDLRA